MDRSKRKTGIGARRKDSAYPDRETGEMSGVGLAPPKEREAAEEASGEELKAQNAAGLECRQGPRSCTDALTVAHPERVTQGEVVSILSDFRDVDQLKRAQEALELSHHFLQVLNRHSEMNPLLEELVAVVRGFTGCAAAGILMLDEEGNTICQAYEGFSPEFHAPEVPASAKSGQHVCQYFIRQAIHPGLLRHAEGNSSEINAKEESPATVSAEGEGSNCRICYASGYESVALVPILLREQVLGLIHVADPRENMLSPETVEVLQNAANYLGSAVQRVLAEEALERARDELEMRVRERTAELEKLNEDLSQEVSVRMHAEDQLRALSHRVVEVQEEERQMIARELHDEVGQSLTLLNILVDNSMKSEKENIQDMLGLVKAALVEVVQELREMSLKLRPGVLDDLGLLPALLWHVQSYTDRTDIRVDFAHSGLDRDLPTDIRTAAYRIVQESLTNVARHAGVEEVQVCVRAEESTLVIEVEDRGSGFDPAELPVGKSSGLTGMRERAHLLGGTLTMNARPGHGTRLTARLPLPGRSRAKTRKRSQA